MVASRKPTPPRPSLVLSIGIVGHRANKLAAQNNPAVARQITAILAAALAELPPVRARYAGLFAPETCLALVSSLAQGADSIGADAFLALAEHNRGDAATTFRLEAPLPFEQDEYAKDFNTADALQTYRRLLAAARVLELPGNRGDDPRAYHAAAMTVLGQADLLIAVWDGGLSNGHGGTAETVEFAVRADVPVILVDPKGEASPSLHWRGLGTGVIAANWFEDLPRTPVAAALPTVIDTLLRPPSAPQTSEAGGHHDGELKRLTRFLGERRRRMHVRQAFPLLQMLGGRALSRTDLLPHDPGKISQAYAGTLAPLEPAPAIDPVAEAFGWADFIGTYFGHRFRSAFIVNFFWGALAVLCAALSEAIPEMGGWLAVIELVAVLLVVSNTFIGHRDGWHSRWLEGRELTERLRSALPLWLLGSRPSSFSRAEEAAWPGWYARAMFRMQGMRTGTLDVAHLRATASVVVELLEDQARYHASAGRRMAHLHHRLEGIGQACFVGAAIVAFADLTVHLSGWLPHGDANAALGILAIGLPAIATAVNGVRLVGDFDGIGRRSRRTRHALEALANEIEASPAGRDSLAQLRAWAAAAAGVMLGDVANWRLSAESRGLELP